MIGIWGGLFGIAGFTMTCLVFVQLYGFSFLQGIGNALFALLPGIVISWSYLVLNSDVDILPTFFVMVGAFIGGNIGSNISIKKGNNFIKYAMMSMVMLVCFKLVFDLVENF